MLTQTQLVALHRSLRGERVLSEYIDGAAADPALQRSWRMQLHHCLTDLRTWFEGSPRDERGQFERCVDLFDAALADFPHPRRRPISGIFVNYHTGSLPERHQIDSSRS